MLNVSHPSPSDPSSEADVDTIIVGAGLAGAASAWHLRRSGQRVLILDALQTSTRASGIGGGMANPMMALKGRPIWNARQSLDELAGMGVNTGPAPGLTDLDAALIRPARDNEQARAFREQADAHPDLGRFLEHAECGQFSYLTDTSHGILCVRRGASLDLGQAAAGWLSNTPRTIIETDWTAAQTSSEVTFETSEGRITARHALLCMGYGMLTHPLTRTLKLQGIKGQLIRVRKPKGLPSPLPPISSWVYLVDAGDDSLWIGSTFEHNWSDKGPSDKATRDLLERAGRVIPVLVHADVVEERTGFRVTVPGTRLPMAGPLHQGSRIHVLTGLGARGLLHSAWFAARIPLFFNNPEAIPARCRVVHRSAES